MIYRGLLGFVKNISFVWRGDIGHLTARSYSSENKRLKWYGFVIYDMSIGIMLVERSNPTKRTLGNGKHSNLPEESTPEVLSTPHVLPNSAYQWIEVKKELPPKRVEVLVYHPSAGFAIAEYGNHGRWMRLPDMASSPTHWAMLENPDIQRNMKSGSR